MIKGLKEETEKFKRVRATTKKSLSSINTGYRKPIEEDESNLRIN